MKLKDFYATLLGEYADHPLLAEYLLGPIPNFGGIYKDVYSMLSSGEQVMVDIAYALYSGDGKARVSDLFLLGNRHQALALDAITERLIHG